MSRQPSGLRHSSSGPTWRILPHWNRLSMHDSPDLCLLSTLVLGRAAALQQQSPLLVQSRQYGVRSSALFVNGKTPLPQISLPGPYSETFASAKPMSRRHAFLPDCTRRMLLFWTFIYCNDMFRESQTSSLGRKAWDASARGCHGPF
jgi:hypothetical protein